MNKFNSYGKIEVNNGIRIVCKLDFILYYQWLIRKHYYNTIKIQNPTHEAHITIVNPKIHKNIDCSLANKYIDQTAEFVYFPERLYVSPVNFWIPVECNLADEIKKELKVDDGPNYWGLHITICNKKFKNENRHK
jgi:hypothetical protein